MKPWLAFLNVSLRVSLSSSGKGLCGFQTFLGRRTAFQRVVLGVSPQLPVPPLGLGKTREQIPSRKLFLAFNALTPLASVPSQVGFSLFVELWWRTLTSVHSPGIWVARKDPDLGTLSLYPWFPGDLVLSACWSWIDSPLAIHPFSRIAFSSAWTRPLPILVVQRTVGNELSPAKGDP